MEEEDHHGSWNNRDLDVASYAFLLGGITNLDAFLHGVSDNLVAFIGYCYSAEVAIIDLDIFVAVSIIVGGPSKEFLLLVVISFIPLKNDLEISRTRFKE